MDLLSKYIAGDSLKWLLDQSDPDVRYVTLRDIVGTADEAEYRAAEAYIENSPLIKKKKGGIPGNTDRYDLYYKGAMWVFAEMVSRGLDQRSKIVRETASFLSGAGLLDSGGFSLPWKPSAESALYTGEMMRLFLEAGLLDNSVARGIGWILDRQRHDGGWLHWQVGGWKDLATFLFLNRPGKGLVREDDPSVMSCPYATIACANALLRYQRINPSESVAGAVGRAADYFLRARMSDFGGCGLFNSRLIYRQDFGLPGFPVLGQYDALYGLVFIAAADRFSDPRVSAAFNSLMAMQNGDGTWDQESRDTGMMMQEKQRGWPGKKSKWITLNVFRLLKLAGKTDL